MLTTFWDRHLQCGVAQYKSQLLSQQRFDDELEMLDERRDLRR